MVDLPLESGRFHRTTCTVCIFFDISTVYLVVGEALRDYQSSGRVIHLHSGLINRHLDRFFGRTRHNFHPIPFFPAKFGFFFANTHHSLYFQDRYRDSATIDITRTRILP